MNDIERAYSAAVRYAMRHVQDCCYGRPCLEECLRRLGASLPPCACAGGWRPPRWAKWLALAAVLAVVLFAALHSNAADVQCIWNGSAYVCSGTGSSIEVIGGGSGLPVVVTNFWGVCTNCVAMSPGDCEILKASLTDQLGYIDADFRAISYNENAARLFISNIVDDISSFRRFRSGYSYANATVPETLALSNYIFSVDNTQTELDRANLPPAFSTGYTSKLLFYNDGIYDYAQTLTYSLSSILGYLDSLAYNVSSGREGVYNLSQHINTHLVCDQCQPDYSPGGGGSGGGGSGIATNGNWCTFDQGEAIKDLLRDLKTWAERQHFQLSSISNYVRASYETLRSGLYSDYTAIPHGEDWKDLYLTGQPTGWGYDPTNILQRLEVLLYGISGVGTNSPASLEDTTPDADDAVDDISDSVASIVTDADGTAAKTLGDAVLDFFRAFTPPTKNYQGGEEIIAEVSINVGDDTHYVPALRLGESGFLLDTMTAVKSCVNGFCCVLFWVGGAFVIFRFWAWFASWCVKLSKWAVELCTSLFAS